MEYKVITKDGRAKRAEMKTVHGTIQTPVFMNVGTVGAIKGAVSTDDLRQIGTQVELSNTYHLHVRTGDKLIREFGNNKNCRIPMQKAAIVQVEKPEA